MQEKLQMQVDAVYSYLGRKNPSRSLLDITQIVSDFRLFTKYQLRYKRSLKNQSMFTFVEASFKGLRRTELLCNSEQCTDYIHVSIGRVADW